ncbi:MAG: hypothetical protein HKN10_17395 [Myxococcales bacterium]|nr:hypothetical protein [Myxococcales bacterium]
MMGKAWLPWLVVIGAVGVLATRSMGAADSPPCAERRPLNHHLMQAIAHLDPGSRSPEYRESLAYLKLHARDAVTELSGLVLREPGSFRKWQVTYLIGEFGDESAIDLLRIFMQQPTPRARPARAGSHATDIPYSEEMTSRFQAVSSTARIASHRPELRDQVVETLIATALDIPLLEDSAMFELKALLGDEFQSLRGYFGPEDARHFEPFMPPPQWHGLLARRMEKHRREEQAFREKRETLCRAK